VGIDHGGYGRALKRIVLTILAGLAVICVVAVVDVTLLGGDGKGRRGPRDCLTIQEHRTPCGDSDAWYRPTKETPTSDGCSTGRRRSNDGKRCLEILHPVTIKFDNTTPFPPLKLDDR
jgi:hypothetical protein